MSVMPAMRNIVSARVSIQVLRMMRLNRWTNRRMAQWLMDSFNHDLFEALFYPCCRGAMSKRKARQRKPPRLDCEPCHMPMAWTFLILDVQSFQTHRLVSSPGSIRC